MRYKMNALLTHKTMTNRALTTSALWFGVAIVGLYGHADAGQDPPSQQQIVRWVSLLQSDQFGERELAMTRLAASGSAALPHLEEAACADDLEASRRAVEIIAVILESVGADQLATARKTLERIGEHGSFIARREAQQLLQTIADPEFCLTVRKQLSKAIEAANKEEMHPEVVQDDLVDKLKEASGFRFTSGSRFQGYDWREAKQPSDHPKVLVYRVRWFASGWSRWFVPGINDKDTKTPDGRMWRYFMDPNMRW